MTSKGVATAESFTVAKILRVLKQLERRVQSAERFTVAKILRVLKQ